MVFRIDVYNPESRNWTETGTVDGEAFAYRDEPPPLGWLTTTMPTDPYPLIGVAFRITRIH